MPLEKAYITNLDTKETVPCLFNPTEYSVSKSNLWDPVKVLGEDVPLPKFRGGEAMTLSMTLFFDTYEADVDVREYTEPLLRLMYVDEQLKNKKNKKGRPPLCQFNWGKTWGFNAIITQMTQRFTLFLENGTPVRATVDLTFHQIQQQGTVSGKLKKHQAPASGKWLVKEGDRLDWIAFMEYRDSSKWKLIADKNGLSDVKNLKAGQMLDIPQEG